MPYVLQRAVLMIVLTGMLTLTGLIASKVVLAGQQETVIAVPAFWDAEQTERQWQPLADYLSQQVQGHRFQVRAFKLPQIDDALAEKKADFLFINPSLYVLYTYRFGLSSPLATVVNRVNGHDVSQFAGVIFTRAEHDQLQAVTDLRDKKVAAVSAESLAAYQMQRYRLQQQGLDTETDLEMQFTGLPLPKVVERVLSGEADAGFIRAGVLEQLVREDKLQPDDYRLVGVMPNPDFPLPVSTRLYPEWPFSALPHVEQDLARRVSGALLSMPMHGDVAQALNIAGFTIPGDYREIDQLLQELRLPPFDQLPMLTFRDVWQQLHYYLLFLASLIVVVLSFITLRLYRSRQALQRSQTHIHQLAYYDALTQLPNRASFMARLDTWLGGQSVITPYILLINLDRFKVINNVRGSGFADRLLIQVAERLQQLHGRYEAFRLGGDEFALLSTEPDMTAQVERAFLQALHIDGEYLHLSVSIGSTEIESREAGKTREQILGRASMALAIAKQQGGHQSVHFESEMAEQVSRKFQVEKELPDAIERDELRLYLQSQVDNAGYVVSAEVLVRWQHPEKGLLSPGYFIPVAEESNLIVDLGHWVLQQSCQLLAQWQRQGTSVSLSVNISPRHFRQNNFLEEVADCLARYQISPGCLTLEITENLVIDDIDALRDKMLALRGMGVRLSIDDFGTGYSSLSYLKRLPLDELKIDQSFVQGVTDDPDDAALVDVILAVADKMALAVVAEGVETPEQADYLNARGSVLHQGYLYCKPVPADQWLQDYASDLKP